MTVAATKLDIQKIKTKYRDRMLHLAYIVSGWSPEPDGQRHGAVLAVDGKYIVATGWNGPDRTWQSDSMTPGEGGCGGTCCHAPIVHAEKNAILNARMIGVDLTQCVCYCTKKPCEECQHSLLSAGIQAVMWLQDLSSADSTWVLP